MMIKDLIRKDRVAEGINKHVDAHLTGLHISEIILALAKDKALYDEFTALVEEEREDS